ncbi:FHA domain-containing protein [Lujinxingia vulgaris]|uniref:FHA domain-containing protein n=1 Tax=Lujinxingia vulgaris TaxID=2600176 RepID=UPI001E3BD55A|nr:FHA domain-containing protein [Lujinxingia vulgaris]
MPKLIYQDPEIGTEVIVEINSEVPEVTIGRNPGNIIRINNPSVSRRHTKFVYENGRCTLYDLNSSNGTYVNGMRIQSQVLEHGDLVRVGEFPLEFAEEQPVVSTQVEDPGIASMAKATSMGMGFGMDDFGPEEIELDASSLVEEHELDDQPMVLGEEEIHEVLDPDELYPELEPESFGDDTVDGGAEIAASLAALRAAAQESAGPDAHEHTQRADGHALNLQNWEREFSSGEHEQPPMDAAAPVAAPVAQPVAQPAAQPGGGAPPRQSVAMSEAVPDEEVEALRAEVASLREMLDAGVADSEDMQVERLRGERDRLMDERRTLVRQLNETRQALEQAPTDEAIAEAQAALDAERRRAEEAEAQIDALSQESASRAQAIEEASAREEALQEQLEALQQELQSHQQAQALVDSERAELGSQVSELRDEMQSFEDRYHQALLRIDDVTEELSASLAKVEELEEAAQIGQAERDALQSELADRVHDLELRDERIDALSASLEAEQQKVAELSATIEALNEELSRRPPEDEANALLARATTLDADLVAMTSARDDLQAQLNETNAELTRQRQLLEDLEARHSRVAAERDQVTRERDGLKQEKAAFARETDYLQVERRKLGDENQSLKARVEELEKDRKRKRKIFEELSGDLRGLVEENDRLGGELAKAKENLEQAPTGEALEALRQELAEREELITSLSAQIEELESDASNLTRDLGQIAEERDALAERETELREQLEAARAAQSADFEEGEALEALREEMAELQSQLETAQTDLEEARQAAAEAAEAAEAGAGTDAESAEELAELKAELESAREQIAGFEEERDALTARLAELEAELQARDEASEEDGKGGASDDGELARLVDEKTALEATLAEIILERDRLEDQLRQLAEA